MHAETITRWCSKNWHLGKFFLLSKAKDYWIFLWGSDQLLSRSSHLHVFYKLGNLKNFTKFTGIHVYQNIFFKNVTDCDTRCFHGNFVKFFRIPFLQNILVNACLKNWFLWEIQIPRFNRNIFQAIHLSTGSKQN